MAKKDSRKGARSKKRASRKKVTRKKANGRAGKNEKRELVWVGLGVLVLAVLILAIIFLRQSEYPVETTEQAVIDAFRALGVSEIIIKDLARDFASGNYTLKELKEAYPGFEAEIDAVNDQLRATQNEVLVMVNGEPITRADLDMQLALLPPQYRQLLSDEEVLQEMIDERLLVLEAKRRGINPSDEEVEQAYQELLDKSGLTADQLEENLALFGLTNDDLQVMLRRQLRISALFNQTVDQNITPSREEVEVYYEENMEFFMTEDQVTVKHVLIATQGIRSPAEARERAEEVLARYEDGEDFCTLVREYSDDPGHKEECGEYTFGRGVMVPEFENASFAMQPGETRIVETTFGQHVILKVNESPAHLLPFEEVEPKIVALLASQKRAAAYEAFITALREAANITYVSDDTPIEALETASAELEEAEVETGAEDAVQEVTGSEAASKVTVTVTSEAAEAGEVTDALLSCLATKDVRLYTASWAPVSLDQASQYGGVVTILACDGADEGACAADGVEAYPSWKINGELYEGALSPAELAALTGC